MELSKLGEQNYFSTKFPSQNRYRILIWKNNPNSKHNTYLFKTYLALFQTSLKLNFYHIVCIFWCETDSLIKKQKQKYVIHSKVILKTSKL